MPSEKPFAKPHKRALLNSSQKLRAYPEGTVMFDTYHEFCFVFVLTRDNYDVKCQPERFRIATELDLRKHPM